MLFCSFLKAHAGPVPCTRSFPDALADPAPDFQVRVRPASKLEPTSALRHPSFSACTLPVVLITDYVYNYR